MHIPLFLLYIVLKSQVQIPLLSSYRKKATSYYIFCGFVDFVLMTCNLLLARSHPPVNYIDDV